MKDLKVQTPLRPLLLELNCSLMVQKKKKIPRANCVQDASLPMDLDIHVNTRVAPPEPLPLQVLVMLCLRWPVIRCLPPDNRPARRYLIRAH